MYEDVPSSIMLDKTKLIEIGKKISNIPENFEVHKTLKKIFDSRAQAIKNGKAFRDGLFALAGIDFNNDFQTVPVGFDEQYKTYCGT